jgi:hypothetical protein
MSRFSGAQELRPNYEVRADAWWDAAEEHGKARPAFAKVFWPLCHGQIALSEADAEAFIAAAETLPEWSEVPVLVTDYDGEP